MPSVSRSTRRACGQRPVTRDSWSSPRAIGQMREWPRTAGQYLRPSDPGQTHPGHLVEPVGPRARARVTRDSWSTPWVLEFGHESPGKAGQTFGSPRTEGGHRGPSDPSMIHPRMLVHTAGPRTRSLRARDSWPTLQTGDQSPSGPGELVEPAGTRAQPRGDQECWSNPRSFGPGPELPRTAG